jgi:hypothetical protein
MIKFPSIKSLATQVGDIIKRFPLSVLSSIILTTCFIYLTHQGWDFKVEKYFFWGKLAMCSALGLSLFLATALLSEAKGHNRKGRITVQLITLAVIAVYYFTIDRYEDFNIDAFTRYTLYIIATHLFVAFAAFTGTNKINGFWQFNKTLFLRALLSALYTCVLYGGIALAFWLMDDLLHIEIKYTKYAYMWYVLSGVLNTLIFLAGVPKDLPALESDTSYPKGLKAFTQFVLLPLVTLYLLILYAYFAEIIIHWKLPKGYVSYLVISFSIMGILSLLLIYPIRDKEGNTWIKIFSRWFYVALYPLIVLLGISIYNRISEYGITEHRYFIMVLALWLVFIAAYFLLSKKENIKIIPITLCVFSLLTSTGPWGAFSVSRHSQKNRLEKLLTTNGILVNEKIVKAPKQVTDSVRENITSILRYLDEAHSLKMLQPWFSINIDSIHSTSWGYSEKADTLLKIMDVSEYSNYSSSDGSFELEAETKSNTSFSIKGFDYYSNFEYYSSYSADTTRFDTIENINNFMVGTNMISFIPYHFPCKYALVKDGKTIGVMNLIDLVKGIRSRNESTNGYYYSVPADSLTYRVTCTDSVIYQFRFTSIEAKKINSKSVVGSFAISDIKAIVLTKHE